MFQVSLFDEKDRVVFVKKLTSLPIAEDVIIEHTTRIYDDPDPCVIHRSAVAKVIFSNILDELEAEHTPVGEKISLDQLPQLAKDMLAIPKKAVAILLTPISKK